MKQHTTQRKRYNGEEKVAIVKEHLVGGKKVSALCEQYQIAPSMLYKWQQALFANGAHSIEQKPRRESQQVKRLQQELAKTQAKLANKHEVLSELMSEHLALKKSLGD